MKSTCQQPDIDKIYLYAKEPYETKYQFLIDKQARTGAAFIKYSNEMDNIDKNIEEYKPNKKLKIICFWWYDYCMLSNSKLNPTVTELSIRGRNLNISLVFITQSYFALPKMLG